MERLSKSDKEALKAAQRALLTLKSKHPAVGKALEGLNEVQLADLQGKL